MTYGEQVALLLGAVFLVQCQQCQALQSIEQAAWRSTKAAERTAAALERRAERAP